MWSGAHSVGATGVKATNKTNSTSDLEHNTTKEAAVGEATITISGNPVPPLRGFSDINMGVYAKRLMGSKLISFPIILLTIGSWIDPPPPPLPPVNKL